MFSPMAVIAQALQIVPCPCIATGSDRLQVVHPIGGDCQALCLAQLTQWVSIQLGVTQSAPAVGVVDFFVDFRSIHCA